MALSLSELLGEADPEGANQPADFGDDADFQRWYAAHAQRYRLNPNPDDPSQAYDWRSAYSWGAEPDHYGQLPDDFLRAQGGAPTESAGGPAFVSAGPGEPPPGAGGQEQPLSLSALIGSERPPPEDLAPLSLSALLGPRPEPLVITGATPVEPSNAQLSPITQAYLSPAGQAVSAGILESAPGLVTRAAERALGTPVAAVPQLDSFWQQALALGVSAGIDVPALFTPAGRVARLAIERATATLAEKVGPEAAARLIFSRIGEAAKVAATSGVTFSAADAAKSALEEAAKEGVEGEGFLGETARELGAAAKGAGRGLVTGAAVGAAGEIPSKVMSFLAEVGALTAVPAALEGRIPTVQDLMMNGVQIGVLKLGYKLAGLDFPGAKRMSDAQVSELEKQYLSSLSTDKLRDLRATARPDSPRWKDFIAQVDEVLRSRGEGPAPMTPRPGIPEAPPGAAPPEAGPVPEVPPTAPPPAEQPPVGAPAVPEPSAPPVTGPAALTPEEQTQVEAGKPYVLHDDQRRWWAVDPRTNVTKGPFDFPEEAEHALHELSQPPQPPQRAEGAEGAPPIPQPEPGITGAIPPEIAPAIPAPEAPPEEGPPPARDFTGPLEPDVEQRLQGMIQEIHAGTPGSRHFDPETGEFVGAVPSTYPDWMTTVGRDKKTAIAAIESALAGSRRPPALRAIEQAHGLVERELAQYGPEPTPAEVPAADAAAPFTPAAGTRVQTPGGPGTVAELGPFGEAYVDLDDDGQQTYTPDELSPGPAAPAPIPQPAPEAISGTEMVAPEGQRMARGRLALPPAPTRLALPPAPERRLLRAAPEVRQLPAGTPPEAAAPPLRFEQTAAGPQAIIPGTDIPQVTGGRIRGRPSGPAITSAEAEANLFNQEAVAERERLAESQGELPGVQAAVAPTVEELRQNVAALTKQFDEAGAAGQPRTKIAQALLKAQDALRAATAAPVTGPAPAIRPEGGLPIDVGRVLTYTGPRIPGREGLSPGAKFTVGVVNQDGSYRLIGPGARPVTVTADDIQQHFTPEPTRAEGQVLVGDKNLVAAEEEQRQRLLNIRDKRAELATGTTGKAVGDQLRKEISLLEHDVEQAWGEIGKKFGAREAQRLRTSMADLAPAPKPEAGRVVRGRPKPEAPEAPPAPLGVDLTAVEQAQFERFNRIDRLEYQIANPGAKVGGYSPERRKDYLDKLRARLKSYRQEYDSVYTDVAETEGDAVAEALRQRVESAAELPPEAPAPEKPIWDMTKEEYDAFVKKGGTAKEPPPGYEGGVPSRYALRPDTTREQIQLGQAALADLRAVPDTGGVVGGAAAPARGVEAGAGARTLGLGIPAQFARTGRIDLRGHVVHFAHDLAQLAQVYRDPRFETFRIFYVRDGEIVAHEGITSRVPGAALAFVGRAPTTAPEADALVARTAHDMRDRMERLGADGYWLLHNHPSGSTGLSTSDVGVTQAIAETVAGFQGHVVIDDEEYSVLTPERVNEGEWVTRGIPQPRRPAKPEAALAHPILGQQISGSDELVRLAEAIQSPAGYVTLFYRTASDGRIRAVQEVPVGLFERPEFVDYVRGRARAFGSAEVLAATMQDEGIGKRASALIQDGILRDFVENGTSYIAAGRAKWGGPADAFGRALVGRRVQEAPPPYADNPHYQAIRAALESGSLPPERAEQLGHFASYPDLRELAPPPVATVVKPPKPLRVADRVDALVKGFTEQLQRGEPPGSAQALLTAAERILGPKAMKGPAIRDEIHDAWEGAVNLHLRAQLQDVEGFPERMDLARKAERLLRGRSLEAGQTQRFATPLPLAVAAAHALDIQPGDTIVEPTAGVGNLLVPLPSQNAVIANEMDPRRALVLAQMGTKPAVADALYTPFKGSAVLLAPPFGPFTVERYGPGVPMPYSDVQDLAEQFVVKSLRELPDGGRLAAILPAHVLQNQEFMRWLTGANTLRGLIHSPPDAYASRGTRVDSVLLVADKGRIENAPQPVRATPSTWDEYESAVARLGTGGELERTGLAPPAVDITASADALDTARPGGAWTPQGEAGQAEAPAGGLRREPDDVEAARPETRAARGGRVGGGGVRAPRGRAEDVGPGLVPGGYAGRQPETAGERLRGDVASGTPPQSVPEPNGTTLDGQRYGYRDEGEFRAALDSRIFAPAPLRSGTGDHPHLRLIVKARSLMGAPLPVLQYQPSSQFLQDAYRDGRVSDQQWDYGIVPALQANSRGHGYLAAADVGVGKTRIGAGVVGEWLGTGAAKRVLYVTKNNQNVGDVIREFNLVSPGDQFPFRIINVKDHPEASARRQVEPGKKRPGLPAVDHAVYLVDKYNLAAYAEALQQLGIDGIVGDEVHEYKNATTEVGQTWLDLQKQVLAANGKFLYLTATPATEFDDLRTMIGLREWTFDNFGDYKARVVGLSGRAEHPKAIRDRVERTLYDYAWRKGIPQAQWGTTDDPLLGEWRRLVKPGGPALHSLIDRFAILEGKLLDAIDTLPPPPGGGAPPVPEGAAPAKAAVKGDPFRALISPAEMEQVVREFAMKGKYDAVDLWRAGTEFNVVDAPMAPEHVREYAQLAAFMHRIHDAFVAYGAKGQSQMFGPWTFFQGEAKSRIADYRMDKALDLAQEALKNGEQVIFSIMRVSEGHPEKGWIPAAIRQINETMKVRDPKTGEMSEIPIPEAIKAKERLRQDWAKMRQTRSPVDLIKERFGADQVAVITGEVEPGARPDEQRAFQSGKKPVIVISQAGKTGINLHHVTDTGRGERGRRRVLVVDYEWSSTDFKQGPLGRGDRTGQLTAPRIDMLTAGLAGERKFIATIANRMRNMGSLSRGSAEAASNDKLAEFELGGALDTAAMKESFAELPMEIRKAFLHPGFSRAEKSPQGGIVRQPVEFPSATLAQWLLDIQFMPIEYGNRAFTAFWQARQRLIDRQQELLAEAGAAGRTRSHTGQLLRTTELRKDLVLHSVEDDRGHRYGILQGIITPQMRRLAPFLPRHGVRPARRYVTFNPAGHDQISGLEVGPTKLADIAQAFGASLQKGLFTSDDVHTALRAGDVVAVRGPAPRLFELHMRPSDKVIELHGTKPGDAEALAAAGATRLKDQWVVPTDALPGFLERFPQVEPPVNPTQGETPQKATHANLGEQGGILIDLLAAPYKALTALGRSARSGRPIPTGQVYRAQDPKVEEAITTTRGELGSWWEAINKWKDALGRTFVFEYNLRQYPLEKDEIRVYQAVRRHMAEEARRDMIGVIHPLAVKGDDTTSRGNLELFGRIAVLRDYRSRVSMPNRMPGGVPNRLLLKQIEPELVRLEAIAKTKPAVLTALANYARLMNAEFQDLRARGKLTPDRAIPNYFPHLTLEYQTRFGEAAPGRREMKEPFRPYTKPAKGSEKFIETDFIRAFHQHRFQVLHDNATEDFQLMVLQRHDKARTMPRDQYRAMKPGDRIELNGIEHEAYQLRTGRAIYQAQTIPERLVAQAIAAGAPEIEVQMGEVRQRPALGQYFHLYVVPTPIAERFKNWSTKEDAAALELLRKGTSLWKSNVIAFWGVKGNLTNLLSDLVNIGRADPRSLLYLRKATMEAYRWAKGNPSALIALLDKYDVLQAGYVGRELALSELSGLQLARFPELRDFLTRRQRILADTKWWVKDLLTQELPEKREAIPRVALAMSLLDRVQRGETLKKQARGLDIRGLPLSRAALKIAREAPGDYGKFSETVNKYFRSLAFPFFSWTAFNTTNWIRWALAAPFSATLLFGLRMLLEYWNHSTEDKHRTEEGLPDYIREQAHLNTGIYGEHGMITLFLMGDPMADAMAVVGLEKTPRRLYELLEGKITIGRATREQLLASLGGAEAERMIQLMTPAAKLPLEVALNRSAFGSRRPIVPDELRGTAVGFGMQTRYIGETLFRPMREARTFFEQFRSPQGIDPTTYRYLGGLPIVQTDPKVGQLMEAQRAWEDQKLEVVDTVLNRVKDTARYQALPPRQQIEVLRAIAKETEDRFVRENKPPLTRGFFMEQARR